jgi:Arm DNA-binding domain
LSPSSIAVVRFQFLATAGHRWYDLLAPRPRFVLQGQREDHMLNDSRIRNAKPRERDYKLTDFDGLYVLVRPNGRKLRRFSYRLNGRQKQIALGSYPEVT